MGASTLANWLVVLFMGILFYYVVAESYLFIDAMTARPQAGLNIVPIKVVDDITPLDLYSPGDEPVIIKRACFSLMSRGLFSLLVRRSLPPSVSSIHVFLSLSLSFSLISYGQVFKVYSKVNDRMEFFQ